VFVDIKYGDIKNNEDYLFIDVRSPAEFEEASIPGAINIPLFDNEERAKVGTVYKQQGSESARELGLSIVSSKIPQLVQAVKKSLKADQSPLFFCWRGGMRSRSMATFYDLIYPDTHRLEGGYRAYREYILDYIDNYKINIPTFVLHGMTGVGKTIILKNLEANGVSIIDLEGLAGHRGSAFGAIGDVTPVNQKTFDSRIYQDLLQLQSSEAVVLEAEGKRIGKIIVPENVMVAKEHGIHIMVEASLHTRVNRILEEYKLDENKEDFTNAFNRIERKLPTEVRPLIYSSLENNDFYPIIEILLKHYYDPRYQYSTDQYAENFFKVNSDDLEKASDEIFKYISAVYTKKKIMV